MGMILVSEHILDSFWILWLFRQWENGWDIHPEDVTFYTTQYQEAFLKNVENEYWAKHQRVLVNEQESVPSNNFVPAVTASGSGQSCFDTYYWSSNDEE